MPRAGGPNRPKKRLRRAAWRSPESERNQANAVIGFGPRFAITARIALRAAPTVRVGCDFVTPVFIATDLRSCAIVVNATYPLHACDETVRVSRHRVEISSSSTGALTFLSFVDVDEKKVAHDVRHFTVAVQPFSDGALVADKHLDSELPSAHAAQFDSAVK